MCKWLNVVGFEGYEVNELGQVRNAKTERILETSKCGGYRVVCLRKNNESYVVYVHIIVATAFLPNPLNKPEVNHLDGNGANNELSNLEWSTRKENIDHAWRTGLCKTKNKPYISNDDLVGKTFTSNEGKEFIVDRFHSYDSKKSLNYFVIRFTDSGNEKIVVKSSIQYGCVGDYVYSFEGVSMERKEILDILKLRGIGTGYIAKCLTDFDKYDKNGILITKATNYTI